MLKEKIITITEQNRDHGKMFLIREMPAWQFSKWAHHATSAMARAGIDTEEFQGNGPEAIIAKGVNILYVIHPSEADPLLDEMFDKCVFIVRDKSHPQNALPPIKEVDFEEFTTIERLRAEALMIHVNFTETESLSTLTSETLSTAPNSKTTPTSRASAGKPSRLVRHRS